ncbi:anhydro-N-acetylmuramic acid kinase [Halopseudomonas pelagia]|uniref:Anhydro-N-acetylmuramic acid kinase n=1 Tax=Halopseudomonas pelagia TaxID=553151 RepID=A0AA92IIK9_9GAMM|nr:anhydro-N-acetylmuramic acid kinase [Halopseudomonas pelagia]PCC97394.1 anhydro-N-acetylmuramic acid kinase [Halopseudomonas pelagia]QFY55611.1 anhydro-N-acetylmuramic acid kinase [Halopseudomonas pelagia]
MSHLHVGIMSGTSLDGIDIAITEITPPQQVRLMAACCVPFPDSLRNDLLALCSPDTNEIYRAGIAGQAWARLAAGGVTSLLEQLQLSPNQIATIGSHGQTIRHHPDLGFSLQIGAPALLAELTKICVISDFRSRDIAAGGEGAPLVPAFHDWLLRDSATTRTLVNVGGFANLTIMRPGQPATGFDSGPGNVLLDYWINQHLGQAYDHAGDWARSGKVLPELLNSMLNDGYFQRTGPKSTGREYFNPYWLHQQLGNFPPAAPENVQATLVELSARSIGQAASQYASDSQALYLCGGGARNILLIERLAHHLPSMQVLTTAELGVDPDWMEAMAFAWLAWRCTERLAGNLPAVTGAIGERILGAIYPA